MGRFVKVSKARVAFPRWSCCARTAPKYVGVMYAMQASSPNSINRGRGPYMHLVILKVGLNQWGQSIVHLKTWRASQDLLVGQRNGLAVWHGGLEFGASEEEARRERQPLSTQWFWFALPPADPSFKRPFAVSSVFGSLLPPPAASTLPPPTSNVFTMSKKQIKAANRRKKGTDGPSLFGRC